MPQHVDSAKLAMAVQLVGPTLPQGFTSLPAHLEAIAHAISNAYRAIEQAEKEIAAGK